MATRTLVSFLLLAVTAAAQEEASEVCRSLFCHASHGQERKPCPRCGGRAIPQEDVLCNSCALKDKVCHHCGKKRQRGNTKGPARATPLVCEKEVAISIPSGTALGQITARFFQEKWVVKNGALPPLPSTRPFLVQIEGGVSEEAIAALLNQLDKKLGPHFLQLAFEIRDSSGNYSNYNRIAAAIKRKNGRLLVGGTGGFGIHDFDAINAFNAHAKPADFCSVHYDNGRRFAHPRYENDPKWGMFGITKHHYDAFFDVGGNIFGNMRYASSVKLGLTSFNYGGGGASPEEKAFGAAVVANMAILNVLRQSFQPNPEGQAILCCPTPPQYMDALRLGNTLLWPRPNGEPFDDANCPPAVCHPISGVATKDAQTNTVRVILVNNSTVAVKAKLTISGKGKEDIPFLPFEVKTLVFP